MTARKRGRPPIDAPRDARLELRLRAEERAAIEAAATRDHAISASDWVRRVALAAAEKR